MKRIYYLGIGEFGYAVFYDDEEGQHRVSDIYSTFELAHKVLMQYLR